MNEYIGDTESSNEKLQPLWQKGYRAGIEAMRDEMKTDVAKFYPTDIFPEPPKGQHGKTVDSCSAAAMRVIVPGLADMVAARLLEEKP